MGFDGIQNQISYLSASENGGQTRKVDQHCRIGTINYDSPVELGVAYFQSPFLLRVVSVCFLGVICFLCQGLLNLLFFSEERTPTCPNRRGGTIQAAGDVVLYSSAINACGKAENWPGALALFPGKKWCYLQVLRMLDVQILFGFRTCLGSFAQKSARTEASPSCPFLREISERITAI